MHCIIERDLFFGIDQSERTCGTVPTKLTHCGTGAGYHGIGVYSAAKPDTVSEKARRTELRLGRIGELIGHHHADRFGDALFRLRPKEYF